MPRITFQPANRSLEVPVGTEVLDAARRLGVDVQAPCGGKGTCGKCIVRVVAGQVDSDSLGPLPDEVVAAGHVLACRSRVADASATIEVPKALDRDGGKFSDSAEDAHLIRQELLPEKWEFDPLAVKWFIEVPCPQPGDGLSDLDRLERAIQQQWGKMEVEVGLPLLRQIASALRAEQGRVTVTLVREGDRLHLVGIAPGDTTTRHYGIAIDVGTTTVAVQLVYLPLATPVATRSDYNSQVSCGLDVISRINYARRPGGLEELRRRIVETINGLIAKVCESHGVHPVEISNAVISGNTTMTHLLLGLDPEYIRLDPYTPTVYETPFLSAAEVGLAIHPQTWVCLSPGVGSYVGGDITAGVLCTDLATDTDAINLFIDIGTNGEIVIGNAEFLLACACSAGPAFEGGGIRYGMRASLGAIESVCIDPATGLASYATIGGVRPRGICGSGMISLLADLFLTGWMDAAGKFCRDRPSPAILIQGRTAFYQLASGAETESGEPLVISELDVENIIRAKAAIYSACALMLDQVGMAFEDLAHVYIAGGFGRFLDIDKATVLGLIPDLPRDRFRYIGNSSLMGSYMVLVSRDFQNRQRGLARRMTYLDLGAHPAYMDQYTGALFLPHTDPRRFPSVQPARSRGSITTREGASVHAHPQ